MVVVDSHAPADPPPPPDALLALGLGGTAWGVYPLPPRCVLPPFRVRKVPIDDPVLVPPPVNRREAHGLARAAIEGCEWLCDLAGATTHRKALPPRSLHGGRFAAGRKVFSFRSHSWFSKASSIATPATADRSAGATLASSVRCSLRLNIVEREPERPFPNMAIDEIPYLPFSRATGQSEAQLSAAKPVRVTEHPGAIDGSRCPRARGMAGRDAGTSHGRVLASLLQDLALAHGAGHAVGAARLLQLAHSALGISRASAAVRPQPAELEIMAPEVLVRADPRCAETPASDMWAVGCLVPLLCANERLPFTSLLDSASTTLVRGVCPATGHACCTFPRAWASPPCRPLPAPRQHEQRLHVLAAIVNSVGLPPRDVVSTFPSEDWPDASALFATLLRLGAAGQFRSLRALYRSLPEPSTRRYRWATACPPLELTRLPRRSPRPLPLPAALGPAGAPQRSTGDVPRRICTDHQPGGAACQGGGGGGGWQPYPCPAGGGSAPDRAPPPARAGPLRPLTAQGRRVRRVRRVWQRPASQPRPPRR